MAPAAHSGGRGCWGKSGNPPPPFPAVLAQLPAASVAKAFGCLGRHSLGAELPSSLKGPEAQPLPALLRPGTACPLTAPTPAHTSAFLGHLAWLCGGGTRGCSKQDLVGGGVENSTGKILLGGGGCLGGIVPAKERQGREEPSACKHHGLVCSPPPPGGSILPSLPVLLAPCNCGMMEWLQLGQWEDFGSPAL